jgi:aspartyl-tRNA synthetase
MKVSKLGLESVVRICGQVTQRPDNMQNAESSTGAIELQVAFCSHFPNRDNIFLS